MATTQEYAQLSLYVYNIGEGGNPLNRPDLPQGWTRLEYHPDNLLGLSYGVFQRSGTNEIVLAYTGSNETLTVDYAFTNLPAGLGLPSAQIPAAALIYQQVKEKYGSNITLSARVRQFSHPCHPNPQ